MHCHGLPVADEEAQRVGHVELALGVLRLEPLQHRPKPFRAEGVDAGIDLTERELFRRRVARLDDPREPAVRVTDDAAVGTEVIRLEREHRPRCARGAMGLDKRAQQLRRESRNVAVQHEDVALLAGEGSPRRADRVACPERLLLDGHLDAVEEGGCVGRRHHDDAVGTARARGADDPVDHPPAEERMEVLRRRALHARAEATGHYDC